MTDIKLKSHWYSVSSDGIYRTSSHPDGMSSFPMWHIDGDKIRRGMGHPRGSCFIHEWEIRNGEFYRTLHHPEGYSISPVGLD